MIFNGKTYITEPNIQHLLDEGYMIIEPIEPINKVIHGQFDKFITMVNGDGRKYYALAKEIINDNRTAN